MAIQHKDYAVSCIRLLAMSMIVTCHFMQFYDWELAWWLNVGVQIFFCISGFLYGKKEINRPFQFIFRNFKKILIPYFCLVIPMTILYAIFHPECISLSRLIQVFTCTGTTSGLEHLWFIPYILLCYLLTPCLYWLFRKMRNFSVLGSVVFLAIVVGGGVLDYWYNPRFSFPHIVCYLIGFYFAFAFEHYGKKHMEGLCLWLGILCVVANGVKIYFKYINRIEIPYFGEISSYAHVLLGVSIFLVLYLLLPKHKEGTATKWADRYSYSIYLVHQIFILGPFTLLKTTPYPFVNCVLAVTAIIVSALILKFVSDRVTGFLTCRPKSIPENRLEQNDEQKR